VSSQAIQTLSRIDYSSKCVLVVDDFHQHLQFMAKALKRIGFHNVQLAHNPREALKAADEFNFDIVFSDYNMGDGKNGQQLLQELRHFKKVRFDCIFIMISAETSREVVLGAIESEPEGYIAKPFNEAMLRRKIDRLMDKQACLRAINRAIEDEEYDKAIDQCYISAERHPRYQAWCMKKAAELHLRQGQYDHAQEVYKGVLEERVLDWALMGMARTLMYKGRHGDAVAELKQVLTLNNNCVPAYDLLAECYQQLGDTQAAKEQLMSAAKLSPNSVSRQELLGDACAMNSDFENATQAYKAAVRAAKHSIEETVDGYFKLAGAITDSMAGDMSKQDSNKLVEAQRVLSELDERFEDEAGEIDARRDMVSVRMFLKQQNPERAMHILRELESNDLVSNGLLSPAAVFDYGKTLHNLGDEEKAVQLLEPLLELDEIEENQKRLIRKLIDESVSGTLSDHANELNELGTKLYEQDKLKECIKRFREAVRLAPRSVVVNLNLTQALIRYMELEKVTHDHFRQSQECLSTIGELDEDSRHFARFSNLSERFKALNVEQARSN
jgi:tetratricopeptide (TPR) repeat protein